jgi:PqqD family protein of HPr-rel-A system
VIDGCCYALSDPDSPIKIWGHEGVAYHEPSGHIVALSETALAVVALLTEHPFLSVPQLAQLLLGSEPDASDIQHTEAFLEPLLEVGLLRLHNG